MSSGNVQHVSSVSATKSSPDTDHVTDGPEAYPLAAMSCCGYSFFCILDPSLGCCGNPPGKKVVALEKAGKKVYVHPLSQLEAVGEKSVYSAYDGLRNEDGTGQLDGGHSASSSTDLPGSNDLSPQSPPNGSLGVFNNFFTRSQLQGAKKGELQTISQDVPQESSSGGRLFGGLLGSQATAEDKYVALMAQMKTLLEKSRGADKADKQQYKSQIEGIMNQIRELGNVDRNTAKLQARGIDKLQLQKEWAEMQK
jgi:hypothetical protein